MSQRVGHLRIAPYSEAPPQLKEFSQTSRQVLQEAQRGTLQYSGAIRRLDTGAILLENRPSAGPDGETPYNDFDLIAIRLGNGALSVTMEHSHSHQGGDHDITLGTERETIVFQNVPIFRPPDDERSYDQDPNHIIGHRNAVDSYRSRFNRIYAPEEITEDAERGAVLTQRLVHILAAVGVTIKREEIPQESEVSQDESLSVAA